MQQDKPSATRRDFLKTAAAASGVLASAGLMNVHAQGSEAIRVGLIGCGGRGTGAAEQCLTAAGMANPNINLRLVALGDTFRDQANALRNRLQGQQALRAG